jgi:hypothetical protein
MKNIIKNIKKLFGVTNYRPVDAVHIFVGANPELGVIGLVIEGDGDEEIEVQLEPYRAVALVNGINEMLAKL